MIVIGDVAFHIVLNFPNDTNKIWLDDKEMLKIQVLKKICQITNKQEYNTKKLVWILQERLEYLYKLKCKKIPVFSRITYLEQYYLRKNLGLLIKIISFILYA